MGLVAARLPRHRNVGPPPPQRQTTRPFRSIHRCRNCMVRTRDVVDGRSHRTGLPHRRFGFRALCRTRWSRGTEPQHSFMGSMACTSCCVHARRSGALHVPVRWRPPCNDGHGTSKRAARSDRTRWVRNRRDLCCRRCRRCTLRTVGAPPCARCSHDRRSDRVLAFCGFRPERS